MKSSVIPVFIPHLGCPNECIFCNQRRIAAPKIPSAYEVKEIIEKAMEYSENPQISFYGGSFTCIDEDLQEQYLSVAYEFVNSGRADSIRISTRPDAIDDKVLSRLKKYGVKTVELGAQSMDDEVLAIAKRGHTSLDTEKSSKLIKEAGLELILQIMPGLPASNTQKDMETARKVAALKPDGVRIYPVCVIRDTVLCDMFEGGEYSPLTPESAAELCAEIWDVFMEKDIPIIRTGLNPTEELSNGACVAGAYHPAMGQLVSSQWLFNKACRLIEKHQSEQKLIISVPKGKLSDMRGQKNANMEKLRNRFPNITFAVFESGDQKEPIKVLKV